MSAMRISDKGIRIIRIYEGFSPAPYYCPAGRPSIGFGHAINAGEKYVMIDLAEAGQLLLEDIRITENILNRHVRVLLSQGQFDALCSLVYNWGSGSFLKSAGFRYLNQEKYNQAAMEFFSRERGVVKIKGEFSQGLYNRRQAELRLWNDQT